MKLKPVPYSSVQIEDRFWKPRQETNRRETVWHCLRKLEETGALENFRLAAAGKKEGFRGFVFADSDAYKVLEGAAMLLGTEYDEKLDRALDEIIDLIAKAQMPDGYLNTGYQIRKPDKRFTNLRNDHELYCAGHLFEAAAAHFEAVGKRNLMDVAVRFANLLVDKFGAEAGDGYGGHPELELALVKLARATGDRRYFDLAKRQLANRGTHYYAREHGTPEDEYDGTYWLDDVPIADHEEIKGHAVRAAYLMSGVSDVVAEDGGPEWDRMLDLVWANTILKRTFVTGGIGTSEKNEGFTVDHDLPNLSAYQETCASIALAMWGWRMGLLREDASYFDAVEAALNNAVPAGVSLDGTHFFYENPLASDGQMSRKEWFDCACCPPNVLRTIASVGGYAYAVADAAIFVNLYLPGSVDIEMPDGSKLRIELEGDYPWHEAGKLTIRLEDEYVFHLYLRVPSWLQPGTFRVDGEPVRLRNGYAVLSRTWHDGDSLSIEMPMNVQQLAAHPLVNDDSGRLAVRRGPLIYCAEEREQDSSLEEARLPAGAVFHPQWTDRLGGIVELSAEAEREPSSSWEDVLYQPSPVRKRANLTLIPYSHWANREVCPMEVWLRT